MRTVVARIRAGNGGVIFGAGLVGKERNQGKTSNDPQEHHEKNEVACKRPTDLAEDHRYDYLTPHRHRWSPLQRKFIPLLSMSARSFLYQLNILAGHLCDLFVVSLFLPDLHIIHFLSLSAAVTLLN